MALIDYTTLANVKAYGDVSNTKDDTVISGLITAFSRMVDRYISQVLSAQSVNQYSTFDYYSAIIGRDGMLTFYPETNPVTTFTALQYRLRGTNTWSYIDPTQLDIANNDSGPVVRVIYPDFSAFRNMNVQVQVNMTGGYANTAALPADFEFAVRRLVWWAYKQRSAPMDKTAIPELGQIIIPGSWPPDIKQMFSPFQCYYRH